MLLCYIYIYDLHIYLYTYFVCVQMFNICNSSVPLPLRPPEEKANQKEAESTTKQIQRLHFFWTYICYCLHVSPSEIGDIAVHLNANNMHGWSFCLMQFPTLQSVMKCKRDIMIMHYIGRKISLWKLLGVWKRIAWHKSVFFRVSIISQKHGGNYPDYFSLFGCHFIGENIRVSFLYIWLHPLTYNQFHLKLWWDKWLSMFLFIFVFSPSSTAVKNQIFKVKPCVGRTWPLG